MTDRELMQQALEKLEFFAHMKSVSEDTMRLITALREMLAQPEQKPFCYHDGRDIVGKEYADHSDVFPLYTAQQPRQWQGLTDEDIQQVRENCGITHHAIKTIEAKLKEKNNG